MGLLQLEGIKSQQMKKTKKQYSEEPAVKRKTSTGSQKVRISPSSNENEGRNGNRPSLDSTIPQMHRPRCGLLIYFSS